MKIQIVSDVHLEFGPLELPADGADVLIAAGDIGVGMEGLAWLRHFQCPVLYVAGNHEYWGYELDVLNRQLADESRGTGVHFLENRSVVIGGVRFVGCTLWAGFAGGNKEICEELFLVMNDFRYTTCGDRGLLPEDLIDRHHRSRAWLAEELDHPFDGATVVVTHHAPLFHSWFPDRPDDLIRYAYCNDLAGLMAAAGIDLWVHGHIHRAVDYTESGVRVVANPRGYQGHIEVEGFDPGKIVVV